MESRPKIAIVGASGFIGRNLAGTLASQKKYELTLVNSKDSAKLIQSEFYRQSEFESIIWSASKVNPLIASSRPDLVKEELEYFRTVLKTLEQFDSRLIYISSGGAIYSGDTPPFSEQSEVKGINAYGKAKAILEKAILDSSLDFHILRLSNVYGRDQISNNGQAVIAAWMERIRQGLNLSVFGSLSAKRDFIHIDDVVSACGLVVESHHINEIFNIGSGVGTELSEILKLLKEITNENFLVDMEDQRSLDRPSVWLDIAKSKELLGWVPNIELYEGLNSTWNYRRLT